MPAQLIGDAIEASRNREPLVHAMILLTAARVLAYIDLVKAERVFQEGLRVLNHSGTEARMLNLLRGEAVTLGVPAAPRLAIELYRSLPFDENSRADKHALVRELTAIGEIELALEVYEDTRYPLQGAESLLSANPNPDFQRRVLTAAYQRFNSPRRSVFPVFERFYALFGRHFRLLPPEQATAWLQLLLTRLATTTDERITAQYGDHIIFHTRQKAHLFELRSAIQTLLPPVAAAAILSRYPSVAAAAKALPFGLESISRPAAHPLRPSRYTAIPHLLDEANHLFQEDIQTNTAPRVLWPSCYAYSLALHEAGKQLGLAGALHLEAIPEIDIVLRATIAFVAGVLGLPLHHGLQTSRPLHVY